MKDTQVELDNGSTAGLYMQIRYLQTARCLVALLAKWSPTRSTIFGTSRLAASLLVLVLLLLSFAGCAGIPEGVTPVDNFQVDRYLGTWYEIARFDHSFEQGLSRVTATYRLRDDGGVTVVNRGYSESKRVWKQIEGKAYFVHGPDQGYLKVSFFGPFYGSYIVFELDHENYQYAVVSGPDKSYLWILARTPDIDHALRVRLIAEAAALGFDTAKLTFVHQHD